MVKKFMHIIELKHFNIYIYYKKKLLNITLNSKLNMYVSHYIRIVLLNISRNTTIKRY